MTNEQLKPLFHKVDREPVMVKEEEIKQLSPDEKTYVVLYYLTVDDGEEVKTFDVITGRRATYEFIKNIIENIDIHRSIVMVDNLPYNKSISIYNFMTYIKRFFEEDSFDIEDYNIGDI